jgi:ATP-dependent DNA helicase DinG
MDHETLLRQINEAFQTGGVIENLVGSHYRLNQYQMQYATEAARILNAGRAADGRTQLGLLEASTGTGKTMGYLLPLLLIAAQDNVRVGLSTFTLALQDQIWGQRAAKLNEPPSSHSDLGIALEAVFRMTGVHLSCAMRKGRYNFLSGQFMVNMATEIIAEQGASKNATDLKRWGEYLVERAGYRGELVAERKKADKALSTGAPYSPVGRLNERDFLQSLVKRLGLKHEPESGLISEYLEYHDFPAGINISEVGLKWRSDQSNPFYRPHADAARRADVAIFTHSMAVVDARLNGTVLGEEDLAIVVHDEADKLPDAAESMGDHRLRPLSIRRLAEQALELVKKSAEDADMPSMRAALTDLQGRAKSAQKWLQEMKVEVSGNFIGLESLSSTQREKSKKHVVALCDALDMVQQTKPKGLQSSKLANLMHDLETEMKSAETYRQYLTGAENDDWNPTYPGISWSPVKNMASLILKDIYPARIMGLNWVQSKDPEKPQYAQSRLRTVLFTSATLTTPFRIASADWKTQWHGFLNALGIRSGTHIKNPHALLSIMDPIEPTRFGQASYVLADAHVPAPFIMVPRPDEDDESLLVDSLEHHPEWLSYVVQMLRTILDLGEPFLVLSPSYDETAKFQKLFGIDERVYFHRKKESFQDAQDMLVSGKLLGVVSPAAWEGKNIRAKGGGQLLKHLVITRFPTTPRDDGLALALTRQKIQIVMNTRRLEALRSGNKVEDLPSLTEEEKATQEGYANLEAQEIRTNQAINKVRQGHGRGIRHARDKITVWIADPRGPVHKLAKTGRCQVMKPNPAWNYVFPQRFVKAGAIGKARVLMMNGQLI